MDESNCYPIDEVTTVTCGICQRTMTAPLVEIMDAGWTPEWWVTQTERGDGPACPRCCEFNLDDDRDGPVLKPGVVFISK